MKYNSIIASLILAFVFAPPLWAQDAKPKPDAPADKTEIKKDAKADPAADLLAVQDPAVAAIMAAKPTTPAECAQAANTLAELNHPAEAKQFLKNILDAKLDASQLADLGEQFGSLMFLKMAGKADLLPEAKQLADAVTAALTARIEDLNRITPLIAQLQNDSEAKRGEALAGLVAARQAAVGPLLAVLSDPNRKNEYENVRTVLSQLGRQAREPLAAAIDGADANMKVQAILTLSEMGDAKAAADLIWACAFEQNGMEVCEAAAAALKRMTGRIPSRAESVKSLGGIAKEYFDGRRPIEGVADGRVDLWQWDAEKRRMTAKSGTPEDAARRLAARYARQARSLAPDDAEIRLLYLTAKLDIAAMENGLDRPLDEKNPTIAEIKPLGIRAIEDILEFALAHRHPAAAAAAARLLGEIGTPEKVLRQGDKPTPLAMAAQNADRRVQLAAAQAIVKLRPTKPFAGSSYLVNSLAFIAANSGIRHALVGAPNAVQARELAGMLTVGGFQTTTATTGNELLRLAALSPDYELVMIDVTIDRPIIGMLSQALRHDWRTASLRVGLIARDGYLDLAEKTAAGDPMSKAFSWPRDEKAVRWQLDQLAAIRPDEFVSAEVRLEQASLALDLLAELGKMSNKLYDVRRAKDSVLVALYNPKLTVKAAAVLADLNSAESQRALVDLAGRSTQPLDLRRAAAAAFRRNVEKFGILLTNDEIRRQYDRYNESEKQDAPTQKILGLILDCLEASKK